MLENLIIFVGLIILVSVIWGIIDVWNSSMNKKLKGIWTILFFITSIITLIVWLFVRGKK